MYMYNVCIHTFSSFCYSYFNHCGYTYWSTILLFVKNKPYEDIMENTNTHKHTHTHTKLENDNRTKQNTRTKNNEEHAEQKTAEDLPAQPRRLNEPATLTSAKRSASVFVPS